MHTFVATSYHAMQQSAQFSKSKVQCLVRHRGGNYYASARVSGKLIRRSLDSTDYNVAKNRLAGVLAEMRGAKNAGSAGTLGQSINEEAHREDPAIKETTRHYYRQISILLAKTAAKLPVDPMGVSIKNDDMRQVPLIPAALDLLARMKASVLPTDLDDPVLPVKSPRIALDNACERLGIDHFRVHDLRHVFATRCIESGVDLPTLAAWLGHKDGGVLDMVNYKYQEGVTERMPKC